MELKLYDRHGALKLTFTPSEQSTRRKQLMSDHVLNLSFTAFTPVGVEVYDYVEFGGERFRALEPFVPRQTSTVEWEYDCRFYGVESVLRQTLLLRTVDAACEPVFSLTAPAREHAALVVANLNRQMGTTDWKVGEVVATENLTLDYEGTTCLDALAQLAEAASTEFWFDGMTLNVGRCAWGAEVTLGYGNGLLTLERGQEEDAGFFTRLFPVGSTRNIDPDDYGSSRLRLPGGAAYVERNTGQGIVERYEAEAFAAIYPQRVGTVSLVRSEQKTGQDGAPFTIYYFRDAELPFDPGQYRIGGLVMQVTFRSGELQGREFEVNWDAKTREFEIITQWPYDDSMQLPGGVLVPKAGDEYILWNLRMPKEYYARAEAELLEAVERYFDEHALDRSVYKASTDYIALAERGVTLDVGQRVRLESDHFFPATGFRQSRITALTQQLDRPTEFEIEMSDRRGRSLFERIDQRLGAVEHTARAARAALPEIVRSWESTPASDSNLYSAKRSRQEFLGKQTDDVAEGLIAFRQGLRTADYAPGLTGTGASIDAAGHAEMESLALRRFLEVPELRYNRTQVTVGDKWRTFAAGIVENVDTVERIVTLKLEEGEVGTVRAGDLCMGIFHSQNSAENATADFDDGCGNRRFAGFATSYFRVEEVLDAACRRFRYALRPASAAYPATFAPCAAMTFAAYGSSTDPARRSSCYETRTYQRYLRDVADWEFGVSNIAAQLGDLRNLTVDGHAMTGYSAYLDNVYLRGMLRNAEGNFIVDSRTQSLLLASAETGLGLAFNPEQGLTLGAVYDPATGTFTEQYDLRQIRQTADEAKERIDNLRVGGRNLLVDSNVPQQSIYYPFAEYALSGPIEAGATVTLTVWGRLESSVAAVLLFNTTGAGSAMLIRSFELAEQLKATGKGSVTFPWKIGEDGANRSIQLYARDADNAWESTSLKRVERIQLEYGNVPTDWTPAPEKMLEGIDAAQAAADAAADAASQAKDRLDNLRVGGRNLLRGSGTPVESRDYPFAEYALSGPIEAGATVTLTVWGRLESSVATVLICNSTGAESALLSSGSELVEQLKATGKGSVTFAWKIGENGANRSIQLYGCNADKVAERTSLKRVERIQLEYGNVPTDWTPAPEEVEEEIKEIGQTASDAKDRLDNLRVGGRNLLRGSGTPVESRGYPFATYPLSQPIEAEATVTLTLWGSVEEAVHTLMVYNSSGSTGVFASTELAAQLRATGKASATFPWKIGGDGANRSIQLYARNADNVMDASLKRIDRIQLEYGNMPTDWTPAPEEMQEGIAAAASAADAANATAAEAKEKIDNLRVGGRNLLVDSGRYIENHDYPFAEYRMTEEIAAGAIVTLTIWGEFDERITDIAPYNSGGLGQHNIFRSKEMAEQLKATGKGTHTFPWKIGDPEGKNDRLILFNFYDGAHGDWVTTKKVYRAKLEYGNVSTDWTPAPEDVKQDVDKAQAAADTAAAGVTSLKNFTDTAFADGVVSRAEASSIGKLTHAVGQTRQAADAAYETVCNNPLLGGTAKTNLQAAKEAFDSAVESLLTSIRNASADGIATELEKTDVNAAYSLFTTAYGTFTTRIEEANRHIQTIINNTAEGAYQLSEQLQGIVGDLTQTILPDLQKQIDGSIISWEGDAIPTLANYPASQWTTDTERHRHRGDYYDRFFLLDGERVTERYKFSCQNNVFEWVHVADSGAAQALAEARDALGLAGTKAKIFFGATTPAAPYAVNDVWFRTTGAGASMTVSVYISNVDRGDAQTPSEADWQLVDDSQIRLRQMSTDSVISREEKAALRNTLAQIETEFASYRQDAGELAIPIANLTAAYDALKNYLTGTVAVGNNTDTLLTPEERNTYNARFAGYYTEVSRFTNLVADLIAEQKAAALRENLKSLDYLKETFREDETLISGGLVLSRFIGVASGDTESSPVVAGINGSTLGVLPTRGKLLIFAGANGIQQIGRAKTRIYEDGTLYSSSARLTDATITGNITATSGKIGDFTITGGGLEYKGEGCGYTDVRMNMNGEGLYITGNVGESGVIEPTNHHCRQIAFSTSASAVIDGLFMCRTYATCARITYRNGNPSSAVSEYRQNVGLAISVTGSRSTDADPSRGNIALSLEDGEVMGWRPHIRTVRDTTVTLDKFDTIVHADSSIGEIEIYLPSAPQHAQRYEIRKLTGANWLYVRGNGKKILNFNASLLSDHIRWNAPAEFKLTYNMELGYWVATASVT